MRGSRRECGVSLLLALVCFALQQQQRAAGYLLQPLASSLLDKVRAAVGPSLRERPGFAFSLGVNSWRSAGFEGQTTCLSGSKVRWLCLSTFAAAAATSSSSSSSSSPRPPLETGTGAPSEEEELLDLTVFADASVDVPHLRISLARDAATGATRAQVDYLPRQELLSSLAHYDKYFASLDQEQTALLASTRTAPLQQPPRLPLLSRMVASPFMVDVLLPPEPPEAAPLLLLPLLCHSHIDRWCQWMQAAEPSATPLPVVNARDASVAQVLFEEYKLRFACVLGRDFAPMAEPLALCCIGPAE